MDPITPEVYDHRDEILKQGTPEQRAKFRARISEYEASQRPAAPKNTFIGDFHPEGGAGANVLESEGHEAPPDVIPNEGTRTDWVSATPQEQPLPDAARPAGATPAMGDAMLAAQRPTHQFDESLPNASKLRKFQEPPEYNPPGGSGLPDYIGGSVVHLNEPSLPKFEQDMAPILHARGIPLDSRDNRYAELYSEYSDKQYADAYKQAVAMGTPIVRTDYVLQHDKGLGALADYLAAKGTAKTFAFTEGAMNGIVPGASESILSVTGGPDAVDQYHEGQMANPVTAGAGTLFGSAFPSSLPGEIAGNITRGVGTATRGSRLFGGALGGAAAGMGANALQGLAEGGADPSELGASAAMGGLLGLGGQGLAEGAGGYRKWLSGGELGHELGNFREAGGATDLVKGLKPPDEIREAVELSRKPLPGENKLNFQGSPVEYRAQPLREPLSQANVDAIAREKMAQQKETAAFTAQHPVTNSDMPMKATVNAGIDLLRKLSVPGMREGVPDASAAMAGRNNTQLRAALMKLVKPELVLASQADKAGMEARGAVRIMTLAEAREAGLDPKDFLGGARDPRSMFVSDTAPSGQPAGVNDTERINGDRFAKDLTQQNAPRTELTPSDLTTRASDTRTQVNDTGVAGGGASKEDALRIMLVPKAYNAADMDTQIRILDDLAKEGSSGKPDFVWDQLHAAARDDRSQFGPAWKDLKEAQHQRMLALEQRSGHAVAGNAPYWEMNANDQKSFNSNLEGAGSTQQKEPALSALRSLAGEAGGSAPKDLSLLIGQRSYDALKSSGGPQSVKTVLGTGGAYARLGGLGPAIEFRLDSLARVLSRNPEGMSSISNKDLGPELQAYLARMRTGAKPNPAQALEHMPPHPMVNMFGLGGGALGLRAAQVYGQSDHLDDEDVGNLLALLRARSSGQQQEAR